MSKETVPRNPWPIPTRSRIPYSNDWKSSRWRTLSTMGCSCGWRSHSPFDRTRIPPLSEQGSNTMPLRHGLDFRQTFVYLATIPTRSRRRTTGAHLLLQTPTMGGTQFVFYMVELARFMVDSLSFRKLRRRCTKYWVNGAVFGKILRQRLSWIQFILLQIDRLQLMAVHCNRREV